MTSLFETCNVVSNGEFSELLDFGFCAYGIQQKNIRTVDIRVLCNVFY